MPLRKVSRLKALVRFGLTALAFCSVSCMEGTSSGTETGSAIILNGRVVDQNGKPVPKVEARLVRVGLADTTDADGRYVLVADAGLLPKASHGALDTLDFRIEGHRVAILPVGKWIDTLPDVRLIQRNISGKLLHGALLTDQDANLVLGVLRGTDIPPEHPVTAEFFYNRPANEYSGFLYFPDLGKSGTYEIAVQVYDGKGYLQGQSGTIRFNGLAGDLSIPAFEIGARSLTVSIQGEVPGSRGNPVLVRPGDTVRIEAVASPPRGATAVEYAWKVAGGEFHLSGPQWNYVIPADPVESTKPGSERLLIVRVRDDGDGEAFDTLRLDFSGLLAAVRSRPWNQIASNVEVLKRQHPAIVGAPEGGVFLLGGWSETVYHNTSDQAAARDVWYSRDSRTWVLRSDTLPASMRDPRRAVTFRDSVWVVGGNDTAAEVWCTRDGSDWIKATGKAGYPPRRIPLTAVYRNQIILIGGVDAAGNILDDVWASENGRDWRMLAPHIGLPNSLNGAIAATDSQLIVGSVSGIATTGDGRDWTGQLVDGAQYVPGGHFEPGIQGDSIPPWQHQLMISPSRLVVVEGNILQTPFSPGSFSIWDPSRKSWTSINASYAQLAFEGAFYPESPNHFRYYGGGTSGNSPGLSFRGNVWELNLHCAYSEACRP